MFLRPTLAAQRRILGLGFIQRAANNSRNDTASWGGRSARSVLRDSINGTFGSIREGKMPDVLLVFSDAVFRTRCRSALVSTGFSVRATCSAMSALDLLDDGSPDILVTLAEFGERTLSGIALARMARYRRLHLPVLLVGPPECAGLARDIGPVLPPSITPDDLADEVRTALASAPVRLDLRREPIARNRECGLR